MDAIAKRPPLKVAEVAARMGIHRDTVYAWIRSGVAVGTGRVKLRARYVGGRLMVNRKALREFVDACNGNPDAAPPAAAPKKSERERQAAQATAAFERRTKRK